MKILKVCTAIVASLLYGCGDPVYTDHHEKNNVRAIYWHEANRYSAAIMTGDHITIERLPSDYNFNVRLITDAKPNAAWYECEWQHNTWSGIKEGAWCEIHIASIDELKTGDWNHGKFGTGKTRRIN